MPGRDRTGPQGMGAMTGWGAGYCGDNQGAANIAGCGWQRGGGRGLQNGFGGRGRRNMFYATGQPGWRRTGWDVAAPEQEAQSLKDQAAALENELKLVNQRLAEMENRDKE